MKDSQRKAIHTKKKVSRTHFWKDEDGKVHHSPVAIPHKALRRIEKLRKEQTKN